MKLHPIALGERLRYSALRAEVHIWWFIAEDVSAASSFSHLCITVQSRRNKIRQCVKEQRP
jgi:hypothetical protein